MYHINYILNYFLSIFFIYCIEIFFYLANLIFIYLYLVNEAEDEVTDDFEDRLKEAIDGTLQKRYFFVHFYKIHIISKT